jgi:hypothetical protein
MQEKTSSSNGKKRRFKKVNLEVINEETNGRILTASKCVTNKAYQDEIVFRSESIRVNYL